MSQTVAADPGLQQQQLRQRLAAVRRRLRFVTTFRGSCWLLALLLGAVAVAGLLDWRYHLPSLVRALLLVATLAGAGYVFYRRLFLPLREKDDDLTLALRIEQLYPGLNDSFASAVEFLDTEDEHNSPAMRREAVHRGLRGVSKCDFSRLVNTRGLWRLGALALVLLLVVVGLGVAEPTLAGVALARFAAPFGGYDWPKKTRIELDPVPDGIGKNKPFDVGGRVFGVIPAEALVLFNLDGESVQEKHACPITVADDGKSGTFHTRLDTEKARRGAFAFRVKANDAETDWQTVHVLPPPDLVPLGDKPSPQVHVTYPSYTRLPEIDLEPGTGNVGEVVNGTVVTLRAAANRPLSAAWIEFAPDRPSAESELLLSPLGTGDPRAALAVVAAQRSITEPVRATLHGDRRELSVTFTPPVSGNYVLHFVDESGLDSERRFEVKVFADPTPTVTLAHPAPPDSLLFLPDATLQLQALAEDPKYAVRQVWLEYRCKESDPPRRLPLFVPAADAKEWPLAVPVVRKLPLRQFKHLNPAEGGLKEGDVLLLQVCADDYDDVSAGKEPGRNKPPVEIRIVGQNVLELVVNRDQARVQQELVILKKMQQEATKKVNDAQQHLKQPDGKLTQDDLDQLLQAEEQQRQVRERIEDKKDGVRAEVERIRATLRQNPLPRSGSEKRLERVAEELDRLTRDELPQVESRLTNTRKQDEAALRDEARREKEAEAKEKEADKELRRAEEKEKAAAELERAVKDKPKDAPERARAQQDAAAKRQEAKEARDKAKQLRKEAQELRKEANGPRQLLREAKQHQEEVEKTLADLLGNTLDSFTSTQEVKGEAKSLLEDEKRLQKETEELRQKEMQAMTPEQQKEFEDALDRLRAEQQKLRERTEQLLERMDRVAKDRETRDPQTAKEMKDAAKLARDKEIAASMQKAQDQLTQKHPSDAAKAEKESAEKLQDLVKQLEDRPQNELGRAAQNLRKEEAELQKLQDEMERLRKKREEAKKIPDPKEREQELQRLDREREELEKKIQQKAEQLTRERAARAGQAMQKAAEAMQRAAQKLKRGEDAKEDEQEVLDRLQEARNEVKKARDQTEEELEREELAKVADEIRAIKERQESLIAERERIQKALLQGPKDPRNLLSSLIKLAGNQGAEKEKDEMKVAGLAKDLAALAGKKLEGAPVFARLLKRTSDVMNEAGQRLLEHKDQVLKNGNKLDTEAVADAARLQKEALTRLESVLQTLKEEQNAPLARKDDAKQGGGGEGGEGGGGGGVGNGNEIPPLAQLKLLRQMQAEVNQRTDDFRKAHPDQAKLDDKSKAELRDIRRSQQEVAELLEELIEPGDGGGDKP